MAKVLSVFPLAGLAGRMKSALGQLPGASQLSALGKALSSE